MRIRIPKSSVLSSSDAPASARLLAEAGHDQDAAGDRPSLPPPSAAANLEAFLGRPPHQTQGLPPTQ
jgi:hypothetical protein